MSGRIRTVKPEWLEDELLAAASSDARVLSIALMLLADDYGNGRASVPSLAAEVWRYDMARDDGVHAPSVIRRTRDAFAELVSARFVTLYEVAGQRYFSIRSWAKHQRVDKPGKPRVPGPGDAAHAPEPRATRVAYFVRGRVTGLIKIGESLDPVSRLVELAKAGSETLDLLAVGGVESEHHSLLAEYRVHGEWFRPEAPVLARIREYGGNEETPIASAGYDGPTKVLSTAVAKVPDCLAKVPDVLAPDLRSPTTAPTITNDRESRAPAPAHVREPARDPEPPAPSGHSSRVIDIPRHEPRRWTLAQLEAQLESDYGARWAERYRKPWHLDEIADRASIRAVARWCLDQPDPAEAAREVAAGAFATKRWEGHRIPWVWLAESPGTTAAVGRTALAKARVEPSLGGGETIDDLVADLRRAAGGAP